MRTRRARGPRGLIALDDDGVRRLAIAVLQQAVADLHCPIPDYRRSAAAFMARREDFDGFWCALVGLEGDAVRERLREQISHHEEACTPQKRSTCLKSAHAAIGSRRYSWCKPPSTGLATTR
jgi:hypothetical protein